jgi:hypothetical protein
MVQPFNRLYGLSRLKDHNGKNYSDKNYSDKNHSDKKSRFFLINGFKGLNFPRLFKIYLFSLGN